VEIVLLVLLLKAAQHSQVASQVLDFLKKTEDILGLFYICCIRQKSDKIYFQLHFYDKEGIFTY
jgi:hypothetical protein